MFRGVRSRCPLLLPILREDVVARRVIDAVRRDRARLCMPPLVYLVPSMRLLPVRAMDWLAGFLGVNVSMEQFKGRG
jgi:all-trans-retinol dehydrogenase (NAD+)